MERSRKRLANFRDKQEILSINKIHSLFSFNYYLKDEKR